MKTENTEQYISRDDASELKRIQSAEGVGEPYYLDPEDLPDHDYESFAAPEFNVPKAPR